MGKWTRRAFITTGVLAGGAVIVGVAIRPGDRTGKVAGFMSKGDESMLNMWVKIDPDNTITAIVPHAEMGQGAHTALAMMLADEMDADWADIKIEEAPAHKEYANNDLIKGFLLGDKKIPGFLEETVDGAFLLIGKSMGMQITGGSASVRFTGVHAMRVAGAAAKAVLLQAAADKWSVPIEELKAEKSHIHHAKSNQSAPYADFAQNAAQLSKPANPVLKTMEEYTIMGTDILRNDLPQKTNGTAKFGIDAQVPGMKYATVKAAPVFGTKVKSYDEAAVKDMKGVQKVVNLGDAVAVIADGYWIAKKALDKLNIEFEASPENALNQEDIYNQFSKALDDASAAGDLSLDMEKGDAPSTLSSAAKIVEAEYKVPYLAHATMEPMNCTAWVKDGECELWVGSQNPLGFAKGVADHLEIDQEKVTVHNHYLGGGFGRRAETDVAIQAVRIAKEVDYPVKMIWSREEDTRHDVYREANVSRFKAALDESGKPIAWENQFVYKHHPVEAPYIPYAIGNQLIHYTDSPTHVPWGNWRSVDHSMHAYFTESFIDEVAHNAGKDPYQYRRELLADQPRVQKVLDMAAEKAGWGEELPANWGRGIAVHTSFGTTVAEVVDVEVSNGEVKVHKVVCVADAGFAVHPDGFKAQMESGIIYGLTAALYGEISIENGAVAQSNFHDYQMVRMHEAPAIETYIINSGNPLGGAGEPGTPPIAPALANAIFNATGERIRELPVKNHDLGKEYLGAR